MGTTPVLLIDAVYSAPYLIINPSASISGNQPLLQGDWSAHVIPAPGAAGDNTATPLQTSNYLNLHLFLAFAGTATYSFIFQVLSPSSIAPVFFDVQTLWPGVTGAQALYALVGQMGVGSTIAIRWTLDAPGDGVFLFSYILKEFLGGSASGFPQILYIGSNDAVNTTMGYPIPEGGSFLAVPDAGTQIWGIAQTPIVVNVLEF